MHAEQSPGSSTRERPGQGHGTRWAPGGRLGRSAQARWPLPRQDGGEAAERGPRKTGPVGVAEGRWAWLSQLGERRPRSRVWAWLGRWAWPGAGHPLLRKEAAEPAAGVARRKAWPGEGRGLCKSRPGGRGGPLASGRG